MENYKKIEYKEGKKDKRGKKVYGYGCATERENEKDQVIMKRSHRGCCAIVAAHSCKVSGSQGTSLIISLVVQDLQGCLRKVFLSTQFQFRIGCLIAGTQLCFITKPPSLELPLSLNSRQK